MTVSKEELMSALGDALNAWSGVEFALAALFEIISDIQNQKKANAVFDAIISFDARLDVVDALMGHEGINELELETWKRFETKLKKTYKKRHELAHFTLEGSPPGYRLIPFFTLGTVLRNEARYLTVADVRAREDLFNELRFAFHWLQMEALRRRALLEGNPMPKPLQVVRCEALACQILEERKHKQQRPPAQ